MQSPSCKEKASNQLRSILIDVNDLLPGLLLGTSVFSFAVAITNNNSQCNVNLYLSSLMTSLSYFSLFLTLIITKKYNQPFPLLLIILTIFSFSWWIITIIWLSHVNRSKCDSGLYKLTFSVSLVPPVFIGICIILFFIFLILQNEQQERIP
jgi:hypothetical protein